MAMPVSPSWAQARFERVPQGARAHRSRRWRRTPLFTGLTSRPLLVAALRPVWRGERTLQLGVDPSRAVVLDSVDERIVRLLLDLDGTRTEGRVLADGITAGVDPRFFAALLAQLRAAGALTDGRFAPSQPAGPQPHRPPPDRPAPCPPAGKAGSRRVSSQAAPRDPVPDHGHPGRLAPDLASIALLTSPSAAAGQLRHRQAASVVVHGAGRVGATVATLLAAAGVGNVHVVDHGSVSPSDPSPAGLAVADVDRPKAIAVADAIRRSAPETATGIPGPDHEPDLVVLADGRPVDSDLQAALHASGLPHLAVGVRETTAIIGPLVRPGTTSCLRCANLQRTDRDPAWPLVAAQLATMRRHADEPCDIVLATLAGSVAALHCLRHLDGLGSAASGATLELALPDWRLRRRTWPPHPHCGCGACGTAAAADSVEWGHGDATYADSVPG